MIVITDVSRFSANERICSREHDPAKERPGSTRTLRRGTIDSRSWNAAILAVQKNLLMFPVQVPVSEEQDKILGALYLLCDDLRAKKSLPAGATNRQLAKKYAISQRTVTNWRKKGCPFDKGQWQVLDWMFERPYLPRRAKEKFSCQFQRRFRSACGHVRDIFVLLGEPIPDHLREI
jgi:hypothetical protein